MSVSQGETVIVWDLETVPDIQSYGLAHGMENIAPAQVREAMGDLFPKLPYHRIICIGALIAARTTEGWQLKSAGAPHIGTRTEAELIQAFVNRLDELTPRLVTFNGSGFDLPVLRYRAMKHSVSAPTLSRRPYFNRYASRVRRVPSENGERLTSSIYRGEELDSIGHADARPGRSKIFSD